MSKDTHPQRRDTPRQPRPSAQPSRTRLSSFRGEAAVGPKAVYTFKRRAAKGLWDLRTCLPGRECQRRIPGDSGAVHVHPAQRIPLRTGSRSSSLLHTRLRERPYSGADAGGGHAPKGSAQSGRRRVSLPRLPSDRGQNPRSRDSREARVTECQASLVSKRIGSPLF